MRAKLIAATLVLAAAPSFAHRLDEYLQGTLITIEKNRVQAEMTLTPGVAVFSQLIALIDTDGNGAISDSEQQAYAARVLSDLSIAIDGQSLTPKLGAVHFSSVQDMQEGRGEIRLDWAADLPAGGTSRKVTLENHHQNQISVYLVNALVPTDADLQISEQKRNISQSQYELDYVQAGAISESTPSSLSPHNRLWLGAIALLMLTSFAIRWRARLSS